MDKNTLDFDLEQRTAERIKVIGVGGGGGNAVSHMYKEGIQDVTFLLCNTDVQALKKADIPTKIMLGATVTQGLGAGNRPERARMAAEESADDIQALLNDGTKMVFITAGMGGGTGTGAAPIIAKIAKDMGILTVGIVTIPFRFEGERKIMQALEGVELLGENVDALLVINNERLRMLYPDLTVLNAFAKADDTLTTAAKSIAEIITIEGYMNLDFADVESTMKDGGVALMSNGFGSGDGRVGRAIREAIHSPLMNNNDLFRAKKILFNVSFSREHQMKMEEFNEINAFMARFKQGIDLIWGAAVDESLGEQVKLTLLASGFGIDDIPEIADKHHQEEENSIEGKRRKKLFDEYYGTSTCATALSLQERILVLSEEGLDDDRLLQFMEDNPTYSRNPTSVREMQSKSNPLKVNTTTETSVEKNDPQIQLFDSTEIKPEQARAVVSTMDVEENKNQDFSGKNILQFD